MKSERNHSYASSSRQEIVRSKEKFHFAFEISEISVRDIDNLTIFLWKNWFLIHSEKVKMSEMAERLPNLQNFREIDDFCVILN